MKILFVLFLKLYQYLLSPAIHSFFGPGFGCRHQISCSRFAEKVIQKYPAHQAFLYLIRRVLQCHPWKGNHEKI